MCTFVLVHGGSHGGWCWRRTTPFLQARGHKVYTPTLTGMGERRHLLHKDIGLQTHILDLVNVLEFEDLTDVILVGHSYAGALLPGVAIRASERLRHLVWLDADVMNEGESVSESVGLMTRNQCSEALKRLRHGELTPTLTKAGEEEHSINPLSAWEPLFDIHDDDLRNWVKSKLSDQPPMTMLEPFHAPGFDKLTIPVTYVSCTESRQKEVLKWDHPQRARQRGWPVIEVAAGHDLMVDAPELLASVLDTIAYGAK